jgi:6-phosphogluconolactonase/glucosamine-6-phosphate isomerase/deaminase
MQFIHSPDPQDGIKSLAEIIITELNNGKKVLWLIPGGSNIPITVDVMNIIHQTVGPDQLSNLSITLTDERYGPKNHPDSNWKQFIDAGLNITGIRAYPVLNDKSFPETIIQYGNMTEKLIKESDIIVGQFGMGSDGHIAGILPHTVAVSETNPTSGYESGKFKRITLTFPVLKQIDIAYLFVSEAGKKNAIENLKKDNISPDDQPAQILKEIKSSNVYILS